MRYVTFNVWVGQLPAPLLRNLLTLVVFLRRPHGLFLQEAKRLQRPPRGYKLVQAGSGDEARSSAILVRRDGHIRRTGFWTVPNGDWIWNGKEREPRTFVMVVVQFDKTIEHWINVHRTPRGPVPAIEKNQQAWAAEHRMLVKKVRRIQRRFPGRRIVLGGDWNSPFDWMPSHPKSIRSLADAIGAKVWMVHIDGFLILNGPLDAALRKLAGRYGSDAHRPVYLREKR
jgi:hypothetical protein